ncbi:IclR family transcriptional regulator C-terminal domain-containing protein [Streptomyces sp. NBC_01142]|uniref:IclR family transcriptional regulator domain-containing protein n=1 Tax=Streptomyces sp. NBC_01142 TaxID=2975865 RepID=UPI0022586CEE|nr:IclR family transcriptional regulator C-terminal domain-containing protein [Streptomyces sp. NBC_01142]MCX4826015.1 IclR family transcriptional regulator C-terminal domain-containing protein [Streptomyces sp. NBC_01142]
MTGVSRFNEDSGNRRAPVTPVGLVKLMSALSGPPDFWDRPDGDFGVLGETLEPDRTQRQRANSLYRLGSKALGRNELLDAADWLGEAASCGHPGALFRLVVVALRAGEDWTHEAQFLVAEAARLGHGDASRLLRALGHRRPDPQAGAVMLEDVQYFEEARVRLGIPEKILVPDDGVSDGAGGPYLSENAATTGTAGAFEEGQPQLFLVPAPPVPTEYSPRRPGLPRGHADRDRRRLSAFLAPEGSIPALVLPDLRLDAASSSALSADAGSQAREEPWWSAHALRPAVLTDMARRCPTPTPIPGKWQATQRARDLLHLIHEAGGIDTRTLAQRGQMSMNSTVRLLEWLRAQQLVDTIRGTHHPGPLMKLATGADRDLLQRTLADLRDDLDAAIYLSSYTSGEIHIHEAAHSSTAPPVDEWAPFTDTGHASAVGKSLLAQLDFDSRMDHLARYPSIQLTERTITNPRALVEELDGHGPHAAQFDLLEYSRTEVCVAYSLGLPGRASSIALSLPANQHPRLISAARSLSGRATGILLAHLLTDDTTAGNQAVVLLPPTGTPGEQEWQLEALEARRPFHA